MRKSSCPEESAQSPDYSSVSHSAWAESARRFSANLPISRPSISYTISARIFQRLESWRPYFQTWGRQKGINRGPPLFDDLHFPPHNARCAAYVLHNEISEKCSFFLFHRSVTNPKWRNVIEQRVRGALGTFAGRSRELCEWTGETLGNLGHQTLGGRKTKDRQ